MTKACFPVAGENIFYFLSRHLNVSLVVTHIVHDREWRRWQNSHRERSARKSFSPWAERAPGSSSCPCDLSVPLSLMPLYPFSIHLFLSSLSSDPFIPPLLPHHLPALSLFSAQGDAVLQALIRGPGRREEVGQKVVLETAGEQGWNIE